MEIELKKYYKHAILVLSLALLGSGAFNLIQRGRVNNLESHVSSLNSKIKNYEFKYKTSQQEEQEIQELNHRRFDFLIDIVRYQRQNSFNIYNQFSLEVNPDYDSFIKQVEEIPYNEIPVKRKNGKK